MYVKCGLHIIVWIGICYRSQNDWGEFVKYLMDPIQTSSTSESVCLALPRFLSDRSCEWRRAFAPYLLPVCVAQQMLLYTLSILSLIEARKRGIHINAAIVAPGDS